MSQHGTTTRYTSGCRCEHCRAANAEYQRAYQAKRRAPAAPAQALTSWDIRLNQERRDVPIGVITTHHLRTSTANTTNAIVTVDTRQPLERTLDALVAACQDLREAFAAYHTAKTGEQA